MILAGSDSGVEGGSNSGDMTSAPDLILAFVPCTPYLLLDRFYSTSLLE